MYVALVGEGVYPNCDLCGQCYDSIASRIDQLADDVQRSYLAIVYVWSTYYSQDNKHCYDNKQCSCCRQDNLSSIHCCYCCRI